MSTRKSGRLPLVGITKGADALVLEYHAGGGNDQTSRASLEVLARDRLDPQRSAIGIYFDGTSAQAQTIRVKLLKVGAVIVRNTRRIRFFISSAFPYRDTFVLVARRFASG